MAYIGPKEPDKPPFTHDWKRYEGVVSIPPGTKQIIIAPQIYGPGRVWFDDLAPSTPTIPRPTRPVLEPGGFAGVRPRGERKGPPTPHELFPREYAMKHKPPQTPGIAIGCPRSCFPQRCA